ncbi:MAG: imelysin family protein [Cellvibrionaceae bacterium]
MTDIKHCFRTHMFRLLPWILAILLLSACEKESSDDENYSRNENHSKPPIEITSSQSSETNASIKITADELIFSEKLLTSLVDSSNTLQQSIQQFLTEATEENFKKAKGDWITSHANMQAFAPYLAIQQSNPGLFSFLKHFQISIDTQPIQPGFLDYFSEYSHSGIVNDIALPLTTNNLRRQHGITDNSDVSIGFHAIEYILWGEVGNRPLSDFIDQNTLSDTQQKEGLSVIDLPNNRRRTLLQLQTSLLVDDISALESFWNDQQGLFRTTYFSLPAESRHQLIKSGAILRLKKEFDSLNNLLDTEEKTAAHLNPDNHEFHNQFALKNTKDIIALLTSINASFFMESAPFQYPDRQKPESADQKDMGRQLASMIITMTDKLNEHDNEWLLERALAQDLMTLLKTIINQLDPKDDLDNPSNTGN